MKRWLVLAMITMTCAGCMWPFGGRRHALSSAGLNDGVSIEVLNAPVLHAVKKVYFMPLSAGADAEATQELDRLALVMVKGFAEAASRGAIFELVSGDDAVHADILIKGHVEEYKVRGHFKKTVTLKVRADVRDARNDDVIALVYAQRVCPKKQRDLELAFYEMGYSLAGRLSQ
jgi:hypothetical protein